MAEVKEKPKGPLGFSFTSAMIFYLLLYLYDCKYS